ncbi:MAG: flavin reductase family protein [Geothrix sp.]|uniref:flavin reductase family protein n=1 Tax=Geothrix sp. TaxID=1962974 RepID=UPI0017BB5BAF|nr:flavin reductase family protein [Geothrix sp.]NWJ40728.1 flavin reductase family protein [Geothrix sp.]WIL21266.1 MAG: flavin reductase family protein [Geothrix sp.]
MSHRTILPGDLSPIETNALLCGGVAPRPIALASTISAKGVRNLSPFSFFNAFGSNPPTVAFAPNRRGRDGTVKHTYLNAVATGEFVIAAVSHAMLHPMNVASAEWPDGVDEFPKCGLTPVPARFVEPALVGESPFQMECRLKQVVELGAGPGSGLMLIGEVLAFHVREDCFVDGILHPDALDLVGRNGGAFYTRASGAAVFEVPKPASRPIGYDALPAPLKASRVLTGNDLGQLANSPVLPDLSAARRKPGDPIAPAGLDHAIHQALATGDLAEAWRLAGLRLQV